MLKASIDLGTNTCLLLLAKVESGQITKVRDDFARTIRLGKGVDKTRYLQTAAMERTISCLNDYKKIISEADISPDNVVCVATSQARDAKNGKDFFSSVKSELGLDFKILSGEKEAHLTFLGSLLPDMIPSNYVVVDHGGGSTEFVVEKEGRSTNLGSVRFTERYLKSDPVTDDEFGNCYKEIDLELDRILDWRNTLPENMQMLAVAGTATTLASWHLEQREFNATEIEKVQLTNNDLRRMVEILKQKTVAERRELTGIEHGRADVLLAGAMIILKIMEKLNFPNCRISPRGLRYGVLLNSGVE